DQARRGLAAVILAFGVLDELVEVLLEFVEPGIALEGLIEAKEGENHIRLALRQPGVRRTEVFRTMAEDDFITRDREVTEDKVVFRKFCDDECFQPAIMLHPVGQRVANDANMVALFEFKWRGGDTLRQQRDKGQKETGQ